MHPGANLLHRICTTYKGGANSHPGAFLYDQNTPRVYICTGVYIVHINEALVVKRKIMFVTNNYLGCFDETVVRTSQKTRTNNLIFSGTFYSP